LISFIRWQGFSAELYAFFRDKRGNPLTARDRNGVPPVVR